MLRRTWTRIAASYVALILLTAGVLIALLPATAEQERGTLILLVLLTLFLVSIPAAIFCVLIARSITRPAARLRDAMSRFGTGHLDARPSGTGGGELDQLTADFTRMADRLSTEMRGRTLERNQMAAAFDQMHDGVILTDEAARVGSINRAAARLFSTTPDDAIGLSLIEVTRDYELHNALHAALANPRARQSIEVRVGSRIVSANISAVSNPGSTSATGLVVLQDVTELRQLERIRRDFVANIGHELRTPLASIKLLGDTLQTAMHEDPEGAKEFLNRIDVEVDGLTHLVRELSELSRIESGQVRLERTRLRVADLLERAAGRLRAHAERAGLTITVEPDMGDQPYVWADEAHIEQVLVNLLHNAIKFSMSGPGWQVSLRAAMREGEVVITVADNGAGILPEDLPRIFERFYKGDSSRARTADDEGEREGGTGLGLAIAKHIVQAHGGRIWAESRFGEGATFYFTLPAATC